jgi:Asp-tRNA(Asn)/Glu-tRNA(Gln) amidotransferase A subunit family amidase
MRAMKEPLHRWSAVRLARALATRELTAAALAEALIERRAALEPRLHAWAWFDAARAREQAGALDRRAGARTGLHGLPIAVKDNIDTAGIPTAYGSPIYAGHVPAVDAACVALARAAGAWVLGKTVATEFANMAPAATRNPHGLAHTPGGSSSGSAAAVAAGLAPLALGTQTAGSVIRPAAFCGIIGYKPSSRRIARAGVKANSDTLDEVGVLARSVDDAALLANVLSCRAEVALPSAQAITPRIGVTLTSRASSLSDDMLAMITAAARRLSAAGARVHDMAPWPAAFEALFDAQRLVQMFETARALAPEFQYRRADLSPALAGFLEEAHRIESAKYAAALACGRSASRAIELLFADVDVLITPAAPGAAPRDLSTTGDPVFSRPWQLLDCPCVCVPGGVDSAGLPLGLQVVARPNDDDKAFAAAAWISHSLHCDAITQGRCLD